jgi:hypothetical protein
MSTEKNEEEQPPDPVREAMNSPIAQFIVIGVLIIIALCLIGYSI